VNSGVHIPFYTNIIEIKDANPLLINKRHKLPDNFVPSSLVDIGGGHLATAETKDAFLQMAKHASADGMRLRVVSAYRSIARQRTVYNRNVTQHGRAAADRFSARPGHSEHSTGRALDIVGSFGTMSDFHRTPEYKWVKENAADYGFIIRYQQGATHITGFIYEPWHLTYVGVDIAKSMKINNIKTLEEYIGRNMGDAEVN
jgi:D-alanyl-D-alanine carboxypeptidase